MIILSVQHLQKSFGVNEVLRDVSFTLQDDQRMGLVGVNGCGKTTLLRVLTGELAPDGGVIAFGRDLRVGYLAQKGTVKPGNTVLQELEDVFEPVLAMEARMRELERNMAHAPDERALARVGEEYARLSEAFEAAGGYAWRSSIQGVLAGLGFQKRQHDQPAELLSGGELTRLCLARLLLQKPDLLLLDEPTNHLDLAALDWLENYLTTYRGALIVVSHDRYFLDRVCNCMTELLMGSCESYPGNYSRYSEMRAERFESRVRAYRLQQVEIARMEAIIEKYKSFNREKSLRAAHSREKALERIQRLEKPTDERAVRFRFDARRRTGDDVLSARGLKKAFDGRALFENVSFKIKAGDRVALLGPNGVGKTTLLRCLTGELAQDAGQIAWGANVDIGYYDQQQKKLHNEKTVLREVWDDFPRMLQHEVRGALGLFLFSGDDVFAEVSTLSGGERGRVLLTKLMLRKDNVLLLDEPTNHLDMDSREVLEDALEDFPGTILAISHDRYFINRFATRVAVLTETGVREYAGNFDDYQAALARPQRDIDPEYEGMTRTEQGKLRKRTREQKERENEARAQVEAAEKRVADIEEAIAALEARMATAEVYANPQNAAAAAREHAELRSRLQAAYAEWEELESALASVTE